MRSLLADGALFDVSDPCVSWDARRIVFAGRAHPDSAWRIYAVDADGTDLTTLTRTDRALDLARLGPNAAERFARYDDFDPVWLPSGGIVFASTRFPQLSQAGRFRVSNLFTMRADGTKLERITTERNGAEEPTIDPRTGRIVYARWFFNPYFPAESSVSGLTTDRTLAVRMDDVNLWQVVSILPDGDGIQLAAGRLGPEFRPKDHDRNSTAAYQPCVLADGRVVAVVSTDPTLLGADQFLSLAWYGKGFGTSGPIDDMTANDMLSPVELPDHRIAYAYSSGGEFAIGVTPAQLLVDLPGTDELDPCPLVPRKVPPILRAQGGIDDPAWTLPVTRLDQVTRMDDTFRFDCLNVYLTGPVDSPFPDAPRIARGVKIRFFATLARPDAATGDTVVLVRETKIDGSGAVHQEDMPGDVPMFEQLVDADGHVLRSAQGPAHVPGSNFARTGSGTKCVGCHEGHSALPVPKNNIDAKWFDAATSARVTVSSRAEGAGDPQALVDRRAKGPVQRTGWVARAREGQTARLEWPGAIEAKAFVLYSPTPDPAGGTDLKIGSCELVFYRRGREIGRAVARHGLRPEGTRIEIPAVVLDAVEVRPARVSGTVDHRPALALAEIEVIARLIE